MRYSHLVGAFTLVATLAGCGLSPEDSATELPGLASIEPPITLPQTSPQFPLTSIGDDIRGVVAYYVRGEGLVGRAEIVRSGFSANDLFQLLFAEPTTNDSGTVARSALFQRDDLVEGWDSSDGMIFVDLADTLTSLPGSEQLLIVAQITLTMLSNLPVRGVLFRQGGAPIAIPGIDGQPIIGAAEREDFVSLLVRR